MEVLDYSIIVCYFAIILWIARWVSKGKRDKEFSSVDYFLAGKDQSWVVIGASLFASNIGSEIILAVSGAGVRANMPMANFEILAVLVLILFGWVLCLFSCGQEFIPCLSFWKSNILKRVEITYQ